MNQLEEEFDDLQDLPEPLITRTPGVMLGKPCFVGTRIPVDLVLLKLGEGASVEWILDGYPSLTHEHILAALRFASTFIRHESLAKVAR